MNINESCCTVVYDELNNLEAEICKINVDKHYTDHDMQICIVLLVKCWYVAMIILT